MNIKHFSDWYQVSLEEVFEIGGTTLLTNYYGGSLSKALISLFPENNWEVWKFSQTTQVIFPHRGLTYRDSGRILKVNEAF